MNATTSDFDKDDQEKAALPAILVYPAIFAIVAASLTFIAVAEALIPGSYPIIVSLSLLTGIFFIGRTVMKNFDPETTEALAASIAPNAAAAAAAASAPRNAEDMAEESTEVDVDGSEVTAADTEAPGTAPRTE